MKLKTLERILSKAGLGSRTDARSWIHAGRVRVNGKEIQNPDHWVDLDRDRVLFDNKPLEAAEKVYILLYKPKGYLTTWKDPEGRPTVYDLMPEIQTWVSPVGRLDLDTSGLLILTNDTDFAERLTNPDHHAPKTYQLKASTRLSNEQIDRLRNGVELSDGPTRPAQVTRLRDSEKYTHLEITITEGRNRQVRRMLEAVDSKVLKLVRTAIGPIRIGDLPMGHYRELTVEEVRVLQRGRVPVTTTRRGAWLLLLLIGLNSACSGKKKYRARVPVKHKASTPQADAALVGSETGLASWYGNPYHGRQAANGEIYDMEQFTAAHRTLAFNTIVRVENLENTKTVDVRITDRGPFAGGRILDLSHAAAKAIGIIGSGTARVRLQVIGQPDVMEPNIFGVQVGAFHEESNARRMQATMAKYYGGAHLVLRPGFPALWRVVAGSEPTVEAARELSHRIRAERHVPEAFVVRVDSPSGNN